MQKPAALAARKHARTKIGVTEAPACWICLALVLALVMLAGRIVVAL
jgi:hypothetical protein